VKQGTGPRVLVADSWEWDHHAGQREADGPLARSLDELARGLTALAHDLGRHLARTTIVTVSEFGRAVRENGHGGSEHGQATAMFLIGGGVRRGRVDGAWPGLQSTRGGLAVTTDVIGVLRALGVAPPDAWTNASTAAWTGRSTAARTGRAIFATA
jgi:uncharacterized protein (DUF1501 family)